MKKFSMLSALALSLFAVGCDALQEPIEPRLSPAGMVVTSTTGQRYTVAVEMDPEAGSVSAVIGPDGGRLILGDHELRVSDGAVSGPTTFKMSRAEESPLRVDLTATRVTENDVGSVGFAAPVTLRLNYDEAIVPDDHSVLRIVYFRPDGLIEDIATRVNTGGSKVEADLPHFSMYGVAWP